RNRLKPGLRTRHSLRPEPQTGQHSSPLLEEEASHFALQLRILRRPMDRDRRRSIRGLVFGGRWGMFHLFQQAAHAVHRRLCLLTPDLCSLISRFRLWTFHPPSRSERDYGGRADLGLWTIFPHLRELR